MLSAEAHRRIHATERDSKIRLTPPQYWAVLRVLTGARGIPLMPWTTAGRFLRKLRAAS